MINLPWRRLFHQSWHPSVEELVLYLDGEAGAKTDKVERHLKSCWSCRLRREKIDRVISAFMESRNSSFGDSPHFPTRGLASFDAKLDRLACESGTPALFSGLIRTHLQELVPSVRPLRLAIFLASLILIILVFLRPNSVPSVSAREVLSRAKQAEARQELEVPAPVIYQKLQLRRHSSKRRAETVTLEIWNDTGNRRLRRRVKDAEGVRFPPSADRSLASSGTAAEDDDRSDRTAAHTDQPELPLPSLVAELEQVFAKHQADLGRPLSPDNYELWRHSIRDLSEQVSQRKLPNGEEASILKASGEGPFPLNAIVSTEFTIRQRDWHPIEQRLQVQKEEGIVDFTLGEIVFDVVTLNKLPASVFANPTPPPEANPLLPALPQPLTPPIVDLSMIEADLLAAEVEAWYAIHSVSACLGRPISVVRSGLSQIEVRGVVETEKDKQQVLDALLGIPHVTSRIRTVEEDWAMAFSQRNATPLSPPSTSDKPDAAELSSRKLAIEDALRHYFTAGSCAAEEGASQNQCVQQTIIELSQRTLARSEAVLGQAGALRRLAQWNGILKRADLRTSTRRLLELMVRDHLNALKSELSESQALLEPILVSLLRGDRASAIGIETQSVEVAAAQVAWNAAALRLCASIERTANLILGMFVETNQPVTEGQESMKALLAAFAGLERDFRESEAEITSELSDLPKAATTSSDKFEEKLRLPEDETLLPKSLRR
jgi:hypothetical protein